MTDLEIELHAILVKLMVRFPDGKVRIESALNAVVEAGKEMDLDEWHEKVVVLHRE